MCWEERKEMVDIQSITNTPGSVRVSIKQYFIDKCLLLWGRVQIQMFVARIVFMNLVSSSHLMLITVDCLLSIVSESGK